MRKQILHAEDTIFRFVEHAAALLPHEIEWSLVFPHSPGLLIALLSLQHSDWMLMALAAGSSFS